MISRDAYGTVNLTTELGYPRVYEEVGLQKNAICYLQLKHYDSIAIIVCNPDGSKKTL